MEQMEHRVLELPDKPYGLVVRPAGSSSGDTSWETLVFFRDRIHVLEGGAADGSPLSLGRHLQLTDGATGGAFVLNKGTWKAPVYDVATNCVYFADGYTVMRLDPNNVVTLVAGDRKEQGGTDGVGSAARFARVYSLAADGRGSLYTAEWPKSIRKVVLTDEAARTGGSSGTTVGLVSTVTNSIIGRFPTSLAYDESRHELIAATHTALYRVPLEGAGSGVMVLLAGHYSSTGNNDGTGSAARFTCFNGVLPTPDGRSAYLLDDGWLRKVELESGQVVTLAGSPLLDSSRYLSQLVSLPQGDMGAFTCSQAKLYILQAAEFAASSLQASSAHRPLLDLLQGPTEGPATIAVHIGGKTFIAHRSVLADHSGYFQGLLQGGFAEASGAGEVELPDADSDAFGALLTYMYKDLLPVPDDRQHLRSTAELAERLLLTDASSRLQRLLLAVSTPATLLPDLVWAERHNLRWLATALRARAAQQWPQVVKDTPVEALKQCMAERPDLVARVMKAAGGMQQV